MSMERKSWEVVLDALKERAKELNCLYSIEEVLNKKDYNINEAFQKVVEAIPYGWQFPDVCQAII